jgi:hypothetical protein
VAPAASRQLPPGLGPEDQLAACRCARRAGLAIATAGGRGHGPRRSGRDRWRGHAAPPRRARGPARRAQPTCCASSRQRGAGRAPPAAIAARPAGRGQSTVRRPAAGQLSPTAPAPTSSTSVASVTSPASPSSSSSANSVTIAAKSWPLPNRCATAYHSASGSLARARPAGGHQPPSRAAHRAKVAGQIAQRPQLEHVVLAARRVRQRVPAKAADRLDHGWTVRLTTWSTQCPALASPCQQPAQRGQCLLPAGRDRDRQQRPAGQPRKHRVDQRPPGLTTAARPRTAPLGRHHHLQPAPPIQLRPGSRQVPAGDRLLGPRASSWRRGAACRRRPQAPAPPPPRRRHRPPSPITGP